MRSISIASDFKSFISLLLLLLAYTSPDSGTTHNKNGRKKKAKKSNKFTSKIAKHRGQWGVESCGGNLSGIAYALTLCQFYYCSWCSDRNCCCRLRKCLNAWKCNLIIKFYCSNVKYAYGGEIVCVCAPPSGSNETSTTVCQRDYLPIGGS